MCGILGVVDHSEKITTDAFQAALLQLKHRGPDAEEIWEEKGMKLGHTRLAILDLSDTGKQPMVFEDRYVITYNGEIYNYQELRTELEKDGFRFKGNSDTEVLLYAWVRWREKCLKKFNGMWAFAIWDRLEKTLFLSKDRVGQKPLFYHQAEGQFIFASEMKAIYPFLNNIGINYDLIQKIKMPPPFPGANSGFFRYESTPECLINDISRFPAGHYGIYKNGALRLYRYWDQMENLVEVPKSYNEQVKLLKELLIDSCRLRLQSDVPTGSALSGGIDSSAIAGAISEVFNRNLAPNDNHKSIVACFDGTLFNEEKFAKKVVEATNCKSMFIDVDPLEGIEDLYRQTYLFEELYVAYPISISNFYKKMRGLDIKVSLDGHGGDELFAGYASDLNAALVDLTPNYLKFRQLFKLISNGSTSHIQALKHFKHALNNKYSSNNKTGAYFHEKYQGLDYLNSSLLDNTYKYGLPTLIRNYDRYSMMNGVEVRCPFLDYRILSFAFSLPHTAKYKKGYSKAIIRDAMKGIIPEEVLRTKQKGGFHPPIGAWLKTNLKEWILDETASSSFNQAELIDPLKFRKKLHHFLSDPNSNQFDGQSLWEEFLFYVWEKSLNYAIKGNQNAKLKLNTDNLF